METTPTRPRPSRLRIGLVTFIVLSLALLRPAGAHLRAAALLVRFADPHENGFLAGLGAQAIDEANLEIEGPSGPIRARIYAPMGASEPLATATSSTSPSCSGCEANAPSLPGIVIVHGVHRLGIDEPRLERFARAVAAAGFAVLTPEVGELADYHVDPASIETIGASARALRARLGGGPVGVMGMSFAGGLSLLAAADPRYSEDIGLVVAVGAHHDLARVSQFFMTSRVKLPDGREEALGAHEYGALVLVYSHIESFFSADDAPGAREALRLWLWEQPDEARERANDLRPEARARVLALFDRKLDVIAPDLAAAMEQGRDEMARVSPSGRLATLKCPVFLLHGAGDTVIPAAETLWLASEVPAGLLRGALVSPAVVHVELEGDPPLLEQWALVRFMMGVLGEADGG
jgi:acetyl esterase/lipase